MNHSENSLETLSTKIPKWILWGFVIVAFLGLIDASYLAIKDYTNGGIQCFIFSGCDDVLMSEYNNLFGLPIAAWGVMFYFGMLFLSLLYIDIKHKIILRLMMLGGLTGFIFSLGFIYLQLFIIKAICTYCMMSALTSTMLFILSIFAARFHFWKIENEINKRN